MVESVHQSLSSASAGVVARVAAAQALYRVRSQGQSLTRVLARPHSALPVTDQALVQEMVYGALRLLPRLEAVLKRLLNRPLKPSDQNVEALILIGLYQLIAMNTATHAAVSVTVEASRLLGKPAFAALVNALLRRFLRERETLLAEVELEPAARWLFPDWLLARMQTEWPAHWEQLVDASNSRPPMALRINRLRIAPAEYLARLTAAEIAAQPIPHSDAGVQLAQPRSTRELLGFAEGWVSVQDSGAQLAAQWLNAQPGQRVLDACAAPGGKTAAILERADNALNLVAIDSDATRLATVHTTLTRLGLTAQVLVANATAPAGDWCAQPFDRILLDVPCSGTGVIRRHPDIKWLRRERDIPALAATQAHMLNAIWPLLMPGGRLLYATCSLLAAENHQQIAAFLARTADARELPLPTTAGQGQVHGRQWLPTLNGSDGFYYALLERIAS
ncbi:16S rRNA (cytosine(967)-C(5))-methyltransferase [Chromatium weissei]|nr:16S rRNA (cytosine(967)-C(5))-methyltransferase [Chromatium weissei]